MMKSKTKIFNRSMTTSEWKKNNARIASFDEGEEELLNNESAAEGEGVNKRESQFLELPVSALDA